MTPGVAEHTAVTLDAPGFRDGYLGRWTEGGEPMTAIALRFDDATAAATYLTSAAQWLENEGWRSDTSTVPGGFVLVDRAVDADGYVPSVGLAQADDMVAEVYVYQQPPGGLSSPDSLLVREYAML